MKLRNNLKPFTRKEKKFLSDLYDRLVTEEIDKEIIKRIKEYETAVETMQNEGCNN